MITQDLDTGAEEGYIRYGASNSYYTPANNIYDILDVVSGSIFSYGPPTFAYQGSSNPFVIKFRDMQVGDSIRFVFYGNASPIQAGSKLPVLSMTINGEEVLLPSKIPQIEGNVYSAYADYQVTQNINNIDISIFVRDDISSNGNDILEGEDVTNVTLQEPPNVCTNGLIYIDVKRTDTIQDNNQGGEVIMEPITLGICEIGYKEYGATTDFISIDADQQAVVSIKYEETTSEVTLEEYGSTPIDDDIESQKVTAEVTFNNIDETTRLALMQCFSKENGAIKATNKVGTAVKKFKVKIHPIKLGTDESFDITIPKCSFTPSIDWKGVGGNDGRTGYKFTIKGYLDLNTKEILQIGKENLV